MKKNNNVPKPYEKILAKSLKKKTNLKKFINSQTIKQDNYDSFNNIEQSMDKSKSRNTDKIYSNS
jgi:hypothetical protein